MPNGLRIKSKFPDNKILLSPCRELWLLRAMESLAELKEQTAVMPVEQRALLAGFLLHSLPDPDYHVSDEDVAERVRKTKSGEIETLSMDGLHMGVFSNREMSGCLSLRPQIDAITTHETLGPIAKSNCRNLQPLVAAEDCPEFACSSRRQA